MTNIEKEALEHLARRPRTCSEIGSLLWGRPHRKPQAFARPGGRLLHRMKREGLVTQYYDGRHFFLWRLTPAGEKRIKP